MSYKKAMSPKIIFLLFVILPTILAGIYYSRFASDQFTTESRFIIQSNDQSDTGSFGLFSGLASLGTSPKDSMAVQDYILSTSFLNSLSTSINVRQLYSDLKIDWWARLPEEASQEDLTEYWNDQVYINYDSTSGISTLEVTTFERESAVEISKAILSKSEAFVNRLSKSVREDAVELAAAEVLLASQELEQIREKIYSFNQKEVVINPQQRATAEEAIVTELKQKLATAEAELTRLKTFMQSDSMKVRALQTQINSITMQISRQQQKWKLTNPVTGKSVTTFIQDTSQFATELALAEKIYESAIAGLRQSKREAKRQQRYLEVIVPPQLPDQAAKPERMAEVITIFLACFMGWGIFSLLIASVKDHLGWV